MLASWYAYPEEEHIGASLILARRRYGQAHWGPSEPVLNAINNSTGNPVLFQTPGGTIWLLFVILKGTYWNDAELQGSCSEDGGATWSSPAALWLTRGMMVRHPPILLDNGSLLLPAYDECANESVLLSSQSPFSSWREAYRFSGPAAHPTRSRSGGEFAFDSLFPALFGSPADIGGATPRMTGIPGPLRSAPLFPIP